MRRKAAVIICVAALAFGNISAMAADTTQETAGLSVAGEEAAEGILTLEGKKWSDYIFNMDGQIIQLPMMYADFTQLGWTTKDDLSSVEFEAMQHDSYVFEKNGHEIIVDICNMDQNAQTADKGVVFWIKSYYGSEEEKKASVELPGGIKTGVSSLEDVKNAYGTPTYENEFEEYKSADLTYSTDSYEEIKLEFDTEADKLENVEIENLNYPENFQKTEASTEVPAAVSAYQKPAQLSNDPSSYQARVLSNVYTFPVPLSTLLADGFTISEEDSTLTIPGNSGLNVYLMNGGQKNYVRISNFEKNAVPIENAWVTRLTVGPGYLDVDAELAGGIKVGMTEEDLKKVLSDWSITPEVDTSETNYTYYKFAMKKRDQQITVTVTNKYMEGFGIQAGHVLDYEIWNDNLPE